jgi:hypothetical protein
MSASHSKQSWPSVFFRPIADITLAGHNHEMNSAIRVAVGTIGVVAAAALAALVIVESRYFSEWNWLWIVGFPLAVTIVLFRRSRPWVWPAAFAWLVICSFLAFVLTTQALGLGM